ncbi:MAG: ATP-binding protein [Clostridia bacterium]|nr:ATP-binding protein [Clostridia bacterium]
MGFNLFQRGAGEGVKGDGEEKARLESYFRTLVENLPGGVAVVSCGKDGALKPEFITGGFAAMSAMTMEQAWELYERDALAGVHPDDRERVSRELSDYLDEGRERFEFTFRIVKGNGEYFWVRPTMSLIRYDEDSFYLYAVYHDITEERQKQEELREKFYALIRQHYQTPTENTLVLGHCNISKRTILKIVDYTGMELSQTYGNQRDEFFFGLSEVIVDDDERREFRDIYLSVAAEEAFERGVRQITREYFIMIPGEKKGRYARFDMNMVETPDSGDVTGIMTVTDVTDKIIEDRILHSASVLNGDFVLNLDVIEDRYTVLSKREGVYCAPPDCGCHTRWMDYMARNNVIPEDREMYLRELEPGRIAQRLKNEGSYNIVFSIFDGNGGTLAKSLAISPVDLRVGRVCLLRTDITGLLAAERKSKNALERALKEAKEANRAKSDFLSRMSHDIRTPLNGVIGMTEILLKENKDPDLQADLETVASCGKFLMSLINDILDISRIESGKMELHPAPYTLGAFINMIDAIICPLMREKNITFDCEMKCGLQCAMLDEVRFNQIFYNLLSNAAKFTPENGHIVFSAVRLSSDDKVEMVRFSVKDNGAGMERDFIDKAFEPFEQMRGHGYGAENRQGVGLGLTIVRELVALMGGKITVYSKPGEGSEFIVDLPIEKCPFPEKAATGRENPSDGILEGKSVLLVEDNNINRLVAERILKAGRMRVICAPNGKIALETFENSPPGTFDVILMDVRMPVMDGLEATRRIRALKRPDAKTIPVLAMSANAYSEDRRMSLEAGMNEHLSKPVETEKLYGAIRKYV